MSETIIKQLIPSLGIYWNRTFQDRDLVRAKLYGDDVSSRQHQRGMEETADCLGRASVPAFSKYNYVPIIITLDERNSADGSVISIGQNPDAVLGPQLSPTDYRAGEVFSLHGPAVRDGYVGYPVYPKYKRELEGLPFIQSSLFSPKAVYVNGVDYFIENSVVYFKKDLDPFLSPDNFMSHDVDEYESQLLLWGAELHQDNDNVASFIPAVPELASVKNDSYHKSALNALYDLSFAGPERKYIKAAAGAVFAVPYVKNDTETVEVVEGKMVATDKAVYRWDKNVPAAVTVGQELHYGDPIIAGVKIYWNTDFEKFNAWNDYYLPEFIADVPLLQLPRGLVGDIPGVTSITVKYTSADIIFVGMDTNGNPRLRFPLELPEHEADAYWNFVWSGYERDGRSMVDDFSKYLYYPVFVVTGTVVGEINPMRFFAENFLNGNVYIIVVDFNSIPEYISYVDSIGALTRVMPAHTKILCYAKLPDQADTLVPMWEDRVIPGYGNTTEDTIANMSEDNITYRWVRV